MHETGCCSYTSLRSPYMREVSCYRWCLTKVVESLLVHNIADGEQVPLTPLPAWSWQQEYIDLNLKINGTSPYNAVGKLLTLNKPRIDIENYRITDRATIPYIKPYVKIKHQPCVQNDERTSAMEIDLSQNTGNQRRDSGIAGGLQWWKVRQAIEDFTPGCELQIRGAQDVTLMSPLTFLRYQRR